MPQLKSPNGKQQKFSGVALLLLTPTLERSIAIVREFLTACESSFYQSSARAESSGEASLHLEAMNEIIVKGSDICSDIEQRINNAFCSVSANRKNESDILNQISTLSNEERTLYMAIDAIAERLFKTYEEEFSIYSYRMAEAFSQVDYNKLPLTPQSVCFWIGGACIAHLKINTTAMLTIFELFEKWSASSILELCEAADQILYSHNILPNIDPVLFTGKQINEQKTSTQIEEKQKIRETRESTTLPNLSDQSLRPAPELPLETNQDKQSISTQDLLWALAKTQVVVSRAVTSTKPRNLVITTVKQTIKNARQKKGSTLSTIQKETIYWVSTFFDLVLIDRHTPKAIKLQLSKIQIPILRLALADNAFFFSETHSARIFINAIADYGISFTKNECIEDEATFRELSAITDFIVNDSRQDLLVFDNACQQLVRTLSDEKQILLDQESGNPVSFLNRTSAETAAFGHNNALMFNQHEDNKSNNEASGTIKNDEDLFNENCAENTPYQNLNSGLGYYLQAVINNKTDTSLNTVNDTCTDNEVKNELDSVLTNEFESKTEIEIEKEMPKMPEITLEKKAENSYCSGQVNDFLNTTWQEVLKKSSREHGQNSIEWLNYKQTSSDLVWVCEPKQSEADIIRLSILKRDLADRLEEGLNFIGLDQPESDQLVSSVLQILGTGRDKINNQYQEPEHTTDIELANSLNTIGSHYSTKGSPKKYIDEAMQLPIGSWLEYRATNSSGVLRCKLSNKFGNETLIFCNRLGQTTLKTTLEKLAHDIQNQRAIVLERIPFFERAIEKILSQKSD